MTYYTSFEHEPSGALREGLFARRISSGGRVESLYSALGARAGLPCVAALSDYTVVVNGRRYTFDWSEFLVKLRSYFGQDEAVVETIISQGDPSEFNIAVGPVFLDFDNAGRVSVLGEWAIMCWAIAFRGGYLVPKYSAESLWGHHRTTALAETAGPSKVRFDHDARSRRLVVDYEFRCPRTRARFLREYKKSVIDGIVERFGIESVADLGWYLAVRILDQECLDDVEAVDRAFLIGKLMKCKDGPIDFDAFFGLGA